MPDSPADLSLVLPAAGRAPARRVRVLGFDLGTTNSTVAEAVLAAGGGGRSLQTVEVTQETPEGEYVHVLVPSVVALHRGKTWIGEGAKRLRARGSELGLAQNSGLFWDCKNDIGLRRTYHRAPAGLRSAAEVGANVLRFLASAAAKAVATHGLAPVPDRVVVTVPASFQAAQRADTLAAAQAAGLPVAAGDLLDEPLAAFLDHASRNGLASLGNEGDTKHLLVFDFGGGTCDTAVFRVTVPRSGEPLRAASLAVSRYHRLGGGDVDAAIVHQILLPRLLSQNGLATFDLDFEEKSRAVVPSLLGLAETLKIGLCSEIRRLKGLGRWDDADRNLVSKTQPGVHSCRLFDGRVLTLTSPVLTARELEWVLQPFLDEELLYSKGDEYRMTCSIFAPIEDALDRAGLDAFQVDACLLAGGSSLIPQVVDAVARRFPRASVLHERAPEVVQAAVARGAALHALSLAVAGRGVIEPVTGSAISIRTSSGLVDLIAPGTALPFPGRSEWAACTDLSVPETFREEPLLLRVELRDAADNAVMDALCFFPPPVRRGEPLRLSYRMDENQVLHLRVAVAARPEHGEYELTRENPLSNVVNPQPKRERLLQIEERLRTGAVTGRKAIEATEEAARLYADLGQREKALSVYRRLLRVRGRPDASILVRMGLLAGELGDAEREEKYFRECAEADPIWGGALFNLALAQRRRGLWAEALASVTDAIRREPDPPYFVFRAMVHETLGEGALRNADLSRALGAFGPVSALDGFELAWCITACRMAGDAARLCAAEAEQKERRTAKPDGIPLEGLLPDLAPALSASMAN
jgi:tetratricopeptide (TPR) repeat protein